MDSSIYRSVITAINAGITAYRNHQFTIAKKNLIEAIDYLNLEENGSIGHALKDKATSIMRHIEEAHA